MIVKGKQTQCVDVDVSPTEIVNAIGRLYDLLIYNKKYDAGNYIDHLGYWQTYDGENHHTGCSEYVRGPKATEAELAIDKEREVFHDVLMKIKSAK